MLALFTAAPACVPPDCDRVDYGTCGNACCTLTVHYPNTSSIALMQALNTSLAGGGPDGRFTLMPTDETYPYPGFADLRPYHPDEISFLGQAHHLTAKRTYTDTVNLLILKESPTANLRAFSTSQIGGAYSDGGQNYKNIVVLLKSLAGMPFVEVSNVGCPKPTSVETSARSRPYGMLG